MCWLDPDTADFGRRRFSSCSRISRSAWGGQAVEEVGGWRVLMMAALTDPWEPIVQAEVHQR